MELTNLGLVEHCKQALAMKTAYMWGCFGQKITSSLIEAKHEQYPNNYSAARRKVLAKLAEQGDVRGCDCAGLIKWYLWSSGDINGKIVYSAETDKGTTGFFNAAKVKGKIETLPLGRLGVVVSKNGHLGIYVGDGKVIECTLSGEKDGVVMTDLADGAWTDWYEIPYITYYCKCTASN